MRESASIVISRAEKNEKILCLKNVKEEPEGTIWDISTSSLLKLSI